jgi:hypothetical protein
MPSKISKFVKAIGVINQVFKPSLVQQHTRLNIYWTLARPVLIYGSEAWTIRKADEQTLQAAEMKFMRKTANFLIYPELSGQLEHTEKMDSSRIQRNILKEWILAESKTTF